MKKIKSLIFGVIMLAVLVPATQALYYLPESDISAYNGYSTYNENGVSAVLEFAVYDTRIQDMSGLDGLDNYDGETYIYAYQIFNMGDSDIESVKIFGFDPAAVTSEDDLGAADTLDGNNSEGVETDDWLLNSDEAVWFFEGGTLIQNETSWFLMIFSDYAPIAGDFEVNPSSDPWVPGGDSQGDPIPEPTTLALLLSGVAFSFKRKK